MKRLLFNIDRITRAWYYERRKEGGIIVVTALLTLLAMNTCITEYEKSPICNFLQIVFTLVTLFPLVVALIGLLRDWITNILAKRKKKIPMEKFTNGDLVPDPGVKGLISYKGINLHEQYLTRCVWPTDLHQRELVCLINPRVYMSSPWSLGHEGQATEVFKEAFHNKYRRNMSHMFKNPKTIMLIADHVGRTLGYSHLLPINEHAFDLYCNGEIADNSFSAAHIVRPGQPAHAILIFSLGQMNPLTMDTKIHDYEKEKLSDATCELWENMMASPEPIPGTAHVLLRGKLHHLETLIQEHFREVDTIPVLVQLDNVHLKRIFKQNKFKFLPKLSKDGCEMMLGLLAKDAEGLNINPLVA